MINNVKDWAEKFDFVSQDVQKMIMARLIERIDIYRGYEMRIQFYIDEEEFDGIKEDNDKGTWNKYFFIRYDTYAQTDIQSLIQTGSAIVLFSAGSNFV